MIRAGFARSGFTRRRKSSTSAPQIAPQSAPITASRTTGRADATRAAGENAEIVPWREICGRRSSLARRSADAPRWSATAECVSVGTALGSTSVSIGETLVAGSDSSGNSPTPSGSVGSSIDTTEGAALPETMTAVVEVTGAVSFA